MIFVVIIIIATNTYNVARKSFNIRSVSSLLIIIPKNWGSELPP